MNLLVEIIRPFHPNFLNRIMKIYIYIYIRNSLYFYRQLTEFSEHCLKSHFCQNFPNIIIQMGGIQLLLHN